MPVRDGDLVERNLGNFERLAEKRTVAILKKLKLLGNLSTRNNYSYAEEHIKQMFVAIDRELKRPVATSWEGLLSAPHWASGSSVDRNRSLWFV